jgi:VanZ family protein
MALIFSLSSQSQLPQLAAIPPEFVAVSGHFIVYAVLAALIWGVLLPQEWPARRRLGVAFIGAISYGLSDELHQAFVTGRDPALFDLAVDAVGAFCALVALGLAARTFAGYLEL